MEKIDLVKQAEEIGIDFATLLSLYSLYIEQTESDIKELDDSITGKDKDRIRTIAHHIKGASLNLELHSLSGIAESIQKMSEADNYNPESLSDLFSEFSRGFKELKLYIKKAGL